MGTTGRVQQFTLNRRNGVRPDSQDVDGSGGRGNGNAGNPGIQRPRTDAIRIATGNPVGDDDTPIGDRIFGSPAAESEARDMGTPDAPRQKRKYTRRAKPDVDPDKPHVTAQMVKDYTVSTFALVAGITKRDHWRVNRPDIEIDPWSEHAATLINSMPVSYVEAIGKYSAAWAVALGLGGMVYIRLRLDAEQSAERRKQTQPKPNPRGNTLVTDDDLAATVDQPVIPTAEGAAISQENLMHIWRHQTGQEIPTHPNGGSNHNYGLGGAIPLTPRDTRGILG